MESQLRDQDLIAKFFVDDPVFRSDSARPKPLQRMFKRFWLADAAIRAPNNVFNQEVDPRYHLRVRFLPVKIIFPRLRCEDEVHALSFNFRLIPLPRLSASIAWSSRLALAGERNR